MSNTAVPLPYDQFYLLADSLASITQKEIKISLTFNFWLKSYTHDEIRKVPKPGTYYNNRFCNDHNVFDHLKMLMPELPLCEENVFAYPGAGSESNFINYQTQKEIEGYRSWASSIDISQHPGFDAQYQKVIEKENSLRSKGYKGKSSALIWGGWYSQRPYSPSSSN